MKPFHGAIFLEVPEQRKDVPPDIVNVPWLECFKFLKGIKRMSHMIL